MENRMRRFPSPFEKNLDNSYVYKSDEDYRAAAKRFIEEFSLTPEQVKAEYLKLINTMDNCLQ